MVLAITRPRRQPPGINIFVIFPVERSKRWSDRYHVTFRCEKISFSHRVYRMVNVEELKKKTHQLTINDTRDKHTPTYKIQIFAGFAEKKTLHSILLRFVYNAVKCCVSAGSSSVRIKTFKNRLTHSQIKGIFSGLQKFEEAIIRRGSYPEAIVIQPDKAGTSIRRIPVLGDRKKRRALCDANWSVQVLRPISSKWRNIKRGYKLLPRYLRIALEDRQMTPANIIFVLFFFFFPLVTTIGYLQRINPSGWCRSVFHVYIDIHRMFSVSVITFRSASIQHNKQILMNDHKLNIVFSWRLPFSQVSFDVLITSLECFEVFWLVKQYERL